jgi:hypothetical protein
MPLVPTLRGLRQEGCEFKANLGYIARPASEKKKKKLTLFHYLRQY